MALTKITSSLISNNTISVTNIADNAIDATKIASNSILTRHIDDDQITGDQLADAITVVTSVTTPLVDAALIDGENFKINGAQGSDGQVLTSTGSGVAWEATSVADGAITSAKLDTNIAIAGTLGVTGAITGTLATAAQTNITSVGTLTYLNTSGSVTMNNSVASGSFLTDGTIYPLRLTNDDTTAGNAVALTFGQGGFDFTNFIASVRTGTGNNPKGDLVFGGRPSDGSTFLERMRIQADGNVGIGTTTPTTALTIRKAIASAAYGQQASMIEFKSYFTGYDTETVKSAIYSGVSDKGTLNTEGGYMAFHVNNDGTMGEKLRIEKSGNVGIGTASPAAKLQVGWGSDQLQFTNPTAGKKRIGATYTGYVSDNIHASMDLQSAGSSGGDISFNTTPSGGSLTERLRIDESGNVNISTNWLQLFGNNTLFSSSGAGGLIIQSPSGADTTIFRTSSATERLRINSTGPLLPAGDFGYHTTQQHYTHPNSPGSFSTATNAAYTSSTQYWPDQGEKMICVINARAYTRYLHIKTNLTANNVMFYFRTKGYFYGTGMEEQLVGGYTYYDAGNLILSKDNKRVAGDTHSGDTYRATDGSLVLKVDVNQTGYTEGKMLVFFGSHAPSTVSGITVTAVTQKDDGTNAF
jgi:hypothetical protein